MKKVLVSNGIVKVIDIPTGQVEWQGKSEDLDEYRFIFQIEKESKEESQNVGT